MGKRIQAILFVIALLRALRITVGQECPPIAGYTFYPLEGAAEWVNLRRLPYATDVAEIAAACDKTARCNAFTTTGELGIAPMEPAFTALDGPSSDCDGIYIARDRTLSGLVLPAGVDAITLRQDGAKKLQDMQALKNTADKVAAKLLQRGVNPRSARNVAKDVLTKAFEDAGVALSQSSDVGGSYTFDSVMAALTYPEWDSRTANGTSYNFISPVRDQGGCGSCVAFASTAAAEAAVAVGNSMANNSYDFSEQWLFFCNGKYTPDCSNGWYGAQAADAIVSFGLPYEVNYPYVAAPGCTLASPPEVRAGGAYTRTSYTDINLAKQHIRNFGGVMTFFAVYNDFFGWNAAKPPYTWDGVSPLAGYHEVFTIGYNDTGAYWIAKNSWGAGWGDNGFFRISYTANVGYMSAGGDNIIGLTWTSSAFCGDGQCRTGETCSNCPSDCGICVVCGDGTCSAGETCSSCPSDCGYLQPDGTRNCCGDKTCSATAGETCTTCATDCGGCPSCNRNGICEPALGEKCVTGTAGCADCGTCSSSYCGDGKCTPGTKSKPYNETCSQCPTDCGTCGDKVMGFCGDGLCSPTRGETSATCPYDCSKGPRRLLSGSGLSGFDGQGGAFRARSSGNGDDAPALRRSLRGGSRLLT